MYYAEWSSGAGDGDTSAKLAVKSERQKIDHEISALPAMRILPNFGPALDI